MKKQVLSFFCLFSLQSANLSLDPYMSPYVGADLIQTTTQSLIEAEDSLKEEPTNLIEKIGAGAYRFATIGFFWQPYAEFTDTWQHEFFGHGFRIRTSGGSAEAISYNVPPPFPYGDGGGATGYRCYENCGLTTLNAIAFGGTEAETVLAMKLREFFFERDKMDGRFAPLYLTSQQGLLQYISYYTNPADNTTLSREGSDIVDYLDTVNLLNPTTPINGAKLDQIATFALLDPFFWNALISVFTYTIWGKEHSSPAFTVGSIRFSTSISPNLTPAGPEIIADQYLSVGTTPFKTYLRWTPLLKYKSWGAGFKCTDLIRYNGLRIGCIFDGWFAKRLSKIKLCDDYDYAALSNPHRCPGFQLMATLRHPLELSETMLLGVDFGYKTEGYVIGAPLKSTLVGSLIFSIDF